MWMEECLAIFSFPSALGLETNNKDIFWACLLERGTGKEADRKGTRDHQQYASICSAADQRRLRQVCRGLAQRDAAPGANRGTARVQNQWIDDNGGGRRISQGQGEQGKHDCRFYGEAV